MPKAILLGCSIIVSLAAAELAARAVGLGGVVLFARSEDWGFLMQPSQVVYTYGYPVRINSLGLRGPELREPKPQYSKRIVFIGDSVTYGGGKIPEEKLFCRIVENQARNDGLDAEVVNVSAPAWSPQNWWAYIEKRGLHDADAVVLVLPECDLRRLFSTMELGGHTDQVMPLRLQNLAMKVLSLFGHEQLSARQRVDDVIAANLKAVTNLRSKCQNIPLLAVFVPSAVPREPNKQLWSAFEAALPDAIDLRLELQNPDYFFDGTHLSVAGHDFVAQKIYPKIREMIQ